MKCFGVMMGSEFKPGQLRLASVVVIRGAFFGECAMPRVTLTDESKAWFDTDSAVLFKEDTRWDGDNHISVPTRSQWNHEWLYYTKSGKWVLNCFSAYQGTLETHEQISEQDAVEWLILNGKFECDELTELPPEVQEAVKAGFEAAEI